MADNRIYESASNIEKGEANSPASTDGGWRFSKHATETTATPSLEPTTCEHSRQDFESTDTLLTNSSGHKPGLELGP